MDRLKVCFVGIGSIAKRHIRNLNEVCAGRNIKVRIDAFRRSGSEEKPEGVSGIYHTLEELPSDYDVIFITNPTEYHLQTLEAFHDRGRHFFIEKPVVSLGHMGEALQFPLRKDSIYYVACPLRYNAVIRYIRKNIRPGDVISVRSISSSYLPDWRPGQDYRNTYSAHRALGGGVDIDLIHEWDYISWMFGWPEKLMHMSGRKSALEIDSDDYAVYIAEYRSMIAELHLDYFGRKAIRRVELFMKEDTVIGDIVANRISYLKEGKAIDFHEERDDTQKRELAFFLDLVEKKAVAENGFLHGLRVLKLTQGDCSLPDMTGRQSSLHS